MGHEYAEWKQTTQALHAYRQAIRCSAANGYRAWYGLGQTYELMHLYVYAAYYYQKAVALRPYDARMWSALGSVLLAMDQTDAAILAFRRADEDPVAVQNWQRCIGNEGFRGSGGVLFKTFGVGTCIVAL